MARTTTLTVQDLLAGMDDERWLGFGYYGERQNWLETNDAECPARPDEVKAADERVVAEASARGWSRDRLIEWGCSKLGRWFMDTAIGCSDLDRAVRETLR